MQASNGLLFIQMNSICVFDVCVYFPLYTRTLRIINETKLVLEKPDYIVERIYI